MTRAWIGLLIVVMLGAGWPASADVVTDANAKAAEIASRNVPTPIGVRTMAIVQVSVFDAVNAIAGRYPPLRAPLAPTPGASVEAAVAAATRTVLSKVLPAHQAAIDADYHAALKAVPDGRAKTDGIGVGEQAAAAVLASCADDGATAPNVYKPHTTPGLYVPTMFPAVPHWGKRKTWVLTRADQFRPGPPPSLTSDVWKRDLAEIKAFGGKQSAQRTAEQTAIAKFWEATNPNVYWPVARAVAAAPGREVADNARLLALAAMAMDDALVAVFDAKYTYNFWRPVTAIRNTEGDLHDPGWMPFIDTPMHPEYPCAHCIVSSALGAVLEAELAGGPTPTLRSTSPTSGTERTWKSVRVFTEEVALARIYDGVHYRNSTEVARAMGAQIGALAATRIPRVRAVR
jgi:hypothetical protein